jgi:hypothetical protein
MWSLIWENIAIWLQYISNSRKVLATPLFIEMPVPSPKSERSCICVLGLSILPLSTFLIFDFGSVPTVWYFLFFYFITVVYYKLRNIAYNF